MKNIKSFLGNLTLIFITLKLTGYITWSWLWVLSPIWILIIIGFSIGIIAIVFFKDYYNFNKEK